nr:DUF2169 domain-containing protein [Pseudomonas aeruginosa]
MELLNATPLAAAYNQGLDAEGRESLVVIAKGSFDLPLDGREARLLDEQQTLLMVDEFYGEPGFSAPRRECEFVPFKPFCDVLVLGNGDELFVDLVNKTPSGKKLVDLVGFMPHTTTAQAEGICW